ncbi:MAG: helix-turn-helix transcriptional regulator [Saprospiraceae bacterium]
MATVLEIKARIEEIRRQKNIKQEEMAKIFGIEATTYRRMISSKTMSIHFRLVLKFFNAFPEVEPNWVFGFVKPDPLSDINEKLEQLLKNK